MTGNPRALHPAKPPAGRGGGDRPGEETLNPPPNPGGERRVGYPEAHGGRPGRSRPTALEVEVPRFRARTGGGSSGRGSRLPPVTTAPDVRARHGEPVSPRSGPSGRASARLEGCSRCRRRSGRRVPDPDDRRWTSADAGTPPGRTAGDGRRRAPRETHLREDRAGGESLTRARCTGRTLGGRPSARVGWGAGGALPRGRSPGNR